MELNLRSGKPQTLPEPGPGPNANGYPSAEGANIRFGVQGEQCAPL